MEKNAQIEQFNKIKADSLLIVEEVKNLTINGIDDKKGYEAVRAGKMKVVKQIKLIKDERLNITRVFDKLKKEVMILEDDQIEVLEPTKDILAGRQKAIDDEKEMIIRKEQLPERMEMLKTINVDSPESFIIALNNKQFTEFFQEKKEEYLEEKENKLKEEQARQERIEEANKREAQRLIDVENARKEAEEKAKKQAEIDKINAEKEKELALKKADEDKEIAIEREKQKAETEKQRIIDEQKKADDERLAKIKADEKAESDRLQKEKEEAEKLAKQKKYINWLKKNGYTNETKDEFFIIHQDNKHTIYKKLDELIIK